MSTYNYKRFIIIDTELQTSVGHNFNATSRVIESALLAGFGEVLVGCNRHFSADPAAALGVSDSRVVVEAAFVSYAYDHFNEDSYRPAATTDLLHAAPYEAWSFYDELRNFLEKYKVSANDFIYFHTFSAVMADGLLKYLRSKSISHLPNFGILLYMPPESLQLSNFTPTPFLGVLERLAYENYLGNKVCFFVETEGLRQVYAGYGYNFPLLMGPIPADPKAVHSNTGEVVIGYLGEAREEKGFWLIPEIISIMMLRWPEAMKNVRFILQIGGNPGNIENTYVQVALSRLSIITSTYSNIELLGKLDKEGYENLLSVVDIFMLPYDLEAYSLRGSGVAYEALSRGKVLVVPDGIDIANTFNFPNVLKAEHYCPESYAEKLFSLLSSKKREEIDKSAAQKFIAPFLLEKFVGTVCEHSGRHRNVSCRPDILLLCSATLGGGVGMVQRAQIEALDFLGYNVHAIFVPWPTTAIDASRVNAREMEVIDTRRSEFGIGTKFGTFSYVPFARTEEAYLMQDKIWSHGDRYEKNTVKTFSQQMRYLNRDRIAHILNGRDFVAAIVNYPFHVDALDYLDIKVPQIVIETHDLQAKQMYLRRVDQRKGELRTDHITEDYNEEMRLAGKAHALVHISKNLSDYFHKALPSHRHFVCRPCISESLINKSKNAHHSVTRHKSFYQALKRIEQTDGRFINICHDLYEKKGNFSFDLCFMGSSHSSNVLSVRKFIEDVYIEFLMPLGINLLIAGSVCEDLIEYQDRVYLLGPVKNIEELVLSVKVNLLCVEDGTGFPTKIIEILSLGQAFAASRYGFYELAENAEERFPLLDSFDHWIADITSLLLLRPLRSQRGAEGRQFAEQHFSFESYTRTWGTILGRLDYPLPPRRPKLGHSESGLNSPNLIDWDLYHRLPQYIHQMLNRYRPEVSEIMQRLHGVRKVLNPTANDVLSQAFAKIHSGADFGKQEPTRGGAKV